MALAVAISGGCGRAAPAPASPAPRASSSSAPALAPGEAERAALLASLGALEPAEPLATLPAALRSQLGDVLAGLPQGEREAVAGPAGALQAPLLHLVAGGRESNAYLTLATGGAAAALVELRLAAGRPLEGLGPLVTALGRAAATRWLADTAIELSTPAGLTPERCAAIERVAAGLDRGDLRLLAARAARAVAPTAENELGLAEAAARELDLEGARAALAAAEVAAAPKAAELAARIAAARALVAAAELAAAPSQGAEPAALVARARALLALDRAAAAAELLAPHRRAAEGHLGLATAFALAELGGSVCPELPPGSGNLLACAATFRESSAVAQLLPVVEQAFRSGEGRDRTALEAYLGLAHVMPWLYASVLGHELAPEVALKESIEAVTALEARAREAAATEERLAGLVLFVELLRTGLEAAAARQAGARVSVADARRAELFTRAVALGPVAGDEPLAQAAMLGVAAMLAQDSDPGPILTALPAEVDARYRATRATLELWRAVAREDPAAAERGRAGTLALVAEPSGRDRSHLVLTMAEADAALSGRASDYETLLKIATQLDAPELPRATRLRLVLDRAGALARTGRDADAIAALVPFAEPEIGPGTSTEIDLAAMARAYLVVLRARAATGAERAEYAARLAAFASEIEGQVAVGVALWHGLWQRELAALAAAERCRGAAGCLARVERARPAPAPELAKVVGAESARIVARGTVPLGAVTASFTYSPTSGLEPRVTLDPLLLAVELPPPGKTAGAAKSP